ncbi:ubiquinol-cytochrome-c reductase complex assembly factor 1 isoform X1 [Cryptotermes secundus]|uniref:ubiquinol-cytochrome-c reductase complex assembly factor 1 isoform X1 n=2 Tax=Cryptotermes secundus TaxID=105785 RepID=UPI000CD7DA1D|nr:ubiquinol-cytochrome-c reductase complex assembly factor 1 isoform X1 [Cryptotermes secundus]XP_023725595.1 ubiquinol-cytochrome-c reductase complex assembly factor 1 isoform X1 [Cryptotermes secundus]XP_023725598.1 ubiquinol-cytochrome-c reductase complex assembly factor 1 isoform X1 [Cryptotermes secundus]XP_033611323.1 ubiquinol-cytochrome-c reductase complex assembly factor 1 isoform X1 [Cryptotermes secundus]XP_033611324.1 ubiquinol-cytochrome-c reductase complex assembly factor 1 isofo
MHCQHVFQAFKFSVCAYSKMCTKYGLQSFIVSDQLCHLRCLHTHTVRMKSSLAVPRQPEMGYLKSFLKRIGWLDHSKAKLKASAYILYENVADKIPYIKFFKEFQMADTFYSWFLVTELHVWMLMVRTMAEGEEGRFVRNNIVEAMWQDISTRAKKLEPGNSPAVKAQIHELSQQFQAAIIAYDEGLLSKDTVLAGAVWRTFLQQDCNDPENVECLVHYIRKQVKFLDEMARDEILLSPHITWIELPQKFSTVLSKDRSQ